jgi:hypothetical protein
VQIAPSGVSSMLFVTDNLSDPEVFPVGVFEIRVFDSKETLTADDRG